VKDSLAGWFQTRSSVSIVNHFMKMQAGEYAGAKKFRHEF
jgi:hypothetical protein